MRPKGGLNVSLGQPELLLWLSLIPFVTGWMAENHFAPMPVALYGMVLLLCAISYYILSVR